MLNSFIKTNWDSKLPLYEIPHERLIQEGIKCLLIDVDGTILCRNSKNIPPKVKTWIRKSKKHFALYLISNNPSEKRISSIGSELGVNYKFKALKPSKTKTLQVINLLNVEPQNIAIIGDRIFTDIVVGNRCKIKTILVRRINKDGLPIKFNLTLTIEKIISRLFL